MAAISVGLASTTPLATIRDVARAAGDAGLRTLWLNEGPGGDALAGLAAAAEATERILLGVGVIPLDRSPAERIVERLELAGVPLDRFVLGVGSGGAPHPASVVAHGVRELGSRISSPILVGGLGPRVRRIGAELADGLLLNWLPPEIAAAARDEAVVRATALGRSRPHVALYARTAIDPDAHPALRAEAERYAAYPGYAENFARIGRGPLDGSILATDPASLRSRIAEFEDAVDELVLRAITVDNSAGAVRRIIDALGA